MLAGHAQGTYPHQRLAPSNLWSIHLPNKRWSLLSNEGIVQDAAGMQDASKLTSLTCTLHACSCFLYVSQVRPAK